MSQTLRLVFLTALTVSPYFAIAQIPPTPPPARPTPPTRDPHTPGYVTAKELPDGTLPPANADGNFILGPTHNAAPETSPQPASPRAPSSSSP